MGNNHSKYQYNTAIVTDDYCVGWLKTSDNNMTGLYYENKINIDFSKHIGLRLGSREGLGYSFDLKKPCVIFGFNSSLYYDWFEIIAQYQTTTYSEKNSILYQDSIYLGIALYFNLLE